MKKIFVSLAIIGIAAAVVVGATSAYFTDTETSENNTFTAGTVDIAIDGGNPWAGTFTMADMKPCYTDYIDFTITNIGSNPVNVFKTLSDYILSGGTTSEPEEEVDPGDTINDIDTVINYDMRVELYDDAGTLIWWETIYLDSDNVTLDDLEGDAMYLGMIPTGWYMKVMQSYHMVMTAGNQYQGDEMTFDITLTANQLGVDALVLENKAAVAGDLSHTILSDDITASLTYGVKDREFSYSITGKVLTPGKYYLIKYAEPYNGTQKTLGSFTTEGDGTFVKKESSIDLGEDMINAKIWLVPDANYDETTSKMVGWDPSNYLFETGLMDYYDADL